MMHSIAVLSLVLGLAGDPEEIGREQLIRVLDASWVELRDLEFVFEGQIAPLDLKPKPDPIRPGVMTNPRNSINNYQGTLAWRSDESVHLENYVQNIDPKLALSRQVTRLFRGSIARRNRVPDHPSSDVPVSGNPGSILSFNRPMSPMRFLHLPALYSLIKSPYWYYSFRRWEANDGVRLLVVDLSSRPEPYTEGTIINRYWIDMQHGCWPVKVEDFLGPNLRGRDSGIKLVQFQTNDGLKLWVPVGGKSESFVEWRSYSRTPNFLETCSVVNGTVRINQGLPDSRFQLDYEAKPTSEGLVRAKATFEGVAAASRSRQESPQERVDRTLAEADRQSEQLQASAPSRESWVSLHPIPTTLLALGSLTLIGIGFRRWAGH